MLIALAELARAGPQVLEKVAVVVVVVTVLRAVGQALPGGNQVEVEAMRLRANARVGCAMRTARTAHNVDMHRRKLSRALLIGTAM
jgi:hypothetical protein